MRKVIVMLLVLVMAISVVACSKPETEPAGNENGEPTSEFKSDKALMIGVASTTLKENVYIMARDCAMERAEEYGNVSIDWVACEHDVALQMSQVEALIAKGADVIVIEPMRTDAVASIIKLADDAGIPVIDYDALPADCGVKYWLTAKYTDIMPIQVAEFVKIWGDKPAKVAILGGTMGETQVMEMVQSCVDALADYPNFEIVAKQYHQDWDRQLAMNTMETVLEQYPDVNAVFACNDMMAWGARKAAENVGKEKEIYFYGADFDKDTAELILSGDDHFVVINRGNENQGRAVVDMAVEIGNGYDLTYNEIQKNPVTGEDMYCRWVDMSLVDQSTIREQVAQRYPELLK